MRAVNYLSERIILRASDLFLNRKVGTFLDFLNKSQFWSKEKLIDFQNSRLRILIDHACSTVPFYNELFENLNISPEDIRTIDDLRKLPILKKATIKNEGIERFTSSAFPKSKMLTSSSSGSTGEPLFYFITKDAYSMNLAANLRGWYWMGFKLGDKYVKLSQNVRNSPIKILQDRMSRNLYLATNPLIDSNFDYILKEIERYKPKIIRCYPDPLLFLARYKLNHPGFSFKPSAITTTGNTLFPEARKEIETAFGCKIFDSYSCEGNSTVFECPSHKCYHSTEEYGISEVIDDEGNTITTGTGRLISTDLWNLAHPFIRYDTQDYLEIEETPCSCGRKHLRINKILGRNSEVLIMGNGQKYIVHNFTGFFQVDSPQLKRSIDQFQVIKRKDGKVLFRLIVNHNYDETVLNFIRNYWETELKTIVIVETVEHIPLMSGGKRQFIINEK
jgi:phenylacetate-CoA ligase